MSLVQETPVPEPHPHLWRSGDYGWVHSWGTSIGIDGPGCRLVLSTAGGRLRCPCCENSDSWTPLGGQVTPLSTVLHRVRTFRTALIASGGGVTISGGEPLAQPAFTAAFLAGCHQMGLHTALDTSGLLGAQADDSMLAHTDLVLLDIQSSDPSTYRRLTGRELQPTLTFAERLAIAGLPVHVRFVVIPGLTDSPENIDAVARFASGLPNVQRVDVLSHHRLGVAKYAHHGLRYRLTRTPGPGPQQMDEVRRRFAAQGLVVG